MPKAEVVEQQDLLAGAQIDDGVDVERETSTVVSTETPEVTENKEEVVEEKVFSKTDVNKMFSDRHKDGLKEQDEIRTLKERNEELQSQIPQNVRPVIPEMPDTLDENFDVLMKERDAKIVEVTQFDNAQVTADTLAANQQQQNTQAVQDSVNKSVDGYKDRAIKLGMTQIEVEAAGQKLINMGLNGELAMHILDESHGPVITKYLSENLIEFDAINRMTPMQAAVEIATNIKQKAIDSHKPGEKVPAPVDNLDGPGAVEGEGGPVGATYE